VSHLFQNHDLGSRPHWWLYSLWWINDSIILNQALVTLVEQIWFSWALTKILFTNMYNFFNEGVGYLDPSCLHTITKNLHNILNNDTNDNSSIFLLQSNFIICLHAPNLFQHHVSLFSLGVVDCWTIWFHSTSSNVLKSKHASYNIRWGSWFHRNHSCKTFIKRTFVSNVCCNLTTRMRSILLNVCCDLTTKNRSIALSVCCNLIARNKSIILCYMTS